jgi:hypothetical protein
MSAAQMPKNTRNPRAAQVPKARKPDEIPDETKRTKICGILRRSPAKQIDQYQVSTEAPVAAPRNQLSTTNTARYSVRPASPINPGVAEKAASTNREETRETRDDPKPRRREYV